MRQIVIIFDKSVINKKSVNRLLDALTLHYAGIGFAINSEGSTYEIACFGGEKIATLAREFCEGWDAK